jgi:Undecaprenyl-phosphate glucose phosphotransferase
MSFKDFRAATFVQASGTEALAASAAASGKSTVSTAPPITQTTRRRGRWADETRTTVCAILCIVDMAIPAVTGVACYWLTYGVNPVPQRGMIAIIFGAVLTANFLHLAGLYRFEQIRRWRLQIAGVIAGWIATIVVIAGAAAALDIPDAVLKLWAIRWFEATLLALILSRLGLVYLIKQLRRKGMLALNVAIVDMGGRGRALSDLIQSRSNSDVHLLGLFGDANPSAPDARTVDELISLVKQSRVDEVIVSCPELPIPGPVLQRLGALPVNVRVWGDRLRPLRTEATNGDDVLRNAPLLTLSERPLSGSKAVVKRLEDLVVSGAAIVFFAPFMVLIALAIKLESKGPVIFRQQRFGFNSNEITIYKFRTMIASAAVDPHCAQARRGDPRVTRVGRFLRRTSLDELPQLFNVLAGDMSLVGPRPHAVSHNFYYAGLIDGYLARHRVKPGITGWAQVNGLRGEIDSIERMQQRLEYDLDYIDRWSLWGDVTILFRTILVGFINKNAY